MSTESYEQSAVIPCKNAETRSWYAWLDTMPPSPDALFVIGEVIVGNPGIIARLCKREPQGINPNILLLDLHLIQQPGAWPQMQTAVPARFEERPAQHKYEAVEIFCGADSIAQVKVEIVS